MFGNVLIALKEGLDPEPLLSLAAKAAAPSARLHLVTLNRVGTDDDELERLRATGTRLEALCERLKTQGFDATYDVGVVGVGAAFDLARIAEEAECDLMVIGLAKRTRVGKALLGSDAQRVLLAASCPVMVTRMY